MRAKVVPMLHVTDVKASVAWYLSIRFALRATHAEPGCPTDWELLTFGASEVMLSAGGKPPSRDADLYVHVENLEERFRLVEGQAELVETIHDTEYGMREFIIKDQNGFGLTFGEPISPPR